MIAVGHRWQPALVIPCGCRARKTEDNHEEPLRRCVDRRAARLRGARFLHRSRASGGRGHQRRGHERERPRGRRVGHRRNDVAADQVRQDRGYRRRGPVPHSGAAGRDVRRVGARLRPRRFRQGQRHAGRRGGPGSDRRPDAGRCRQGVPRQLLVLADRAAPAARVPRHRRGRQRHRGQPAAPGAVGRHPEAGLHALPPARQPDHPRDRQHRAVRLQPRGMEPPRADGTARLADDERHEPLRPGAGPADVRRMDRPHRHRRGAAGAAAPAGNGAQRRRLDVGVGNGYRLHPRRDHDRQARPARQRQRSGLRREHLQQTSSPSSTR